MRVVELPPEEATAEVTRILRIQRETGKQIAAGSLGEICLFGYLEEGEDPEWALQEISRVAFLIEDSREKGVKGIWRKTKRLLGIC